MDFGAAGTGTVLILGNNSVPRKKSLPMDATEENQGREPRSLSATSLSAANERSAGGARGQGGGGWGTVFSVRRAEVEMVEMVEILI